MSWIIVGVGDGVDKQYCDKMLRDDVIGLHYSWQLILTRSIRDWNGVLIVVTYQYSGNELQACIVSQRQSTHYTQYQAQFHSQNTSAWLWLYKLEQGLDMHASSCTCWRREQMSYGLTPEEDEKSLHVGNDVIGSVFSFRDLSSSFLLVTAQWRNSPVCIISLIKFGQFIKIWTQNYRFISLVRQY